MNKQIRIILQYAPDQSEINKDGTGYFCPEEFNIQEVKNLFDFQDHTENITDFSCDCPSCYFYRCYYDTSGYRDINGRNNFVNNFLSKLFPNAKYPQNYTTITIIGHFNDMKELEIDHTDSVCHDNDIIDNDEWEWLCFC